MRITLNGDATDLPSAVSTVSELLAHLAVDPRIVAVERNRVVIKRARYADTPIADGDEVEIVSFVGGGS